MADPKTGMHPEVERTYKQEKRLVAVGVIIVMLMAMGVFFMLPFPGLLDVKVWGFPFPYFYQFSINWLGPILFGLLMLRLLDKNDAARERAAKEAEKTEAGGGS